MATSILGPRSLARLAGTAGAVVAAIAAVVALTAAAQARRWLGFRFDGVPHQLGEAAQVMLANARFVVGLGAAAALEQLNLIRCGHSEPSGSARMLAAIARGLDGVVAVVILINVVPVGLALGAYGWRMVPALLPHGPFEVLALCVAANLFLNARRRLLAPREWVMAGLVSLSLLSLAAVLETFAWFG
jgi:hypothetical protein